MKASSYVRQMRKSLKLVVPSGVPLVPTALLLNSHSVRQMPVVACGSQTAQIVCVFLSLPLNLDRVPNAAF